jgi:Tol biopolymer transport system component
MDSGRQTVRFPCGATDAFFDDQEAYGGLAFSPDGGALYYGVPGDEGFLDLWARPIDGNTPRRLTGFARDAYDPTVAADGSVVFRSQDYRTFVATAPSDGGPSVPLTTFQSETPTWSWDGTQVALTYGSWRHVTDDIHYPDIAQEIGTVSAFPSTPHEQPEIVVRASPSEDQGMVWSPNGRWIAFHTHVDSDDIWLMPADGSGEARMLSQGGDETGWPRWSPDGRWIVFTSYREEEGGGTISHLFLIGIDQDTGAVTQPQTRIDLDGFEHEIIHGEWADEGETLVFEAVEAFGQKSLWRVSRQAGAPARFHEYGSDQIHSGIGVSPDGRWAAYVDRGPGGYLQIFRVPVGGGPSEQLTFDPTHKTQPAYAPTGDRIAFTVFSYRSHFWRVRP